MRKIVPLLVAALLSAPLIAAASSTPATAAVSAAHPCAGTTPAPTFKHLVVVEFENTSANATTGQVSGAPFVNSLVTGCAHVTRWTDANYKVDMTTKDGSYNSRPSYVTEASGVSPTVHGVKDDGYTSKTAVESVWHQAQVNGIDARAYMEGRASGDVCSGGGSSSGSYHDSLRAFTNIPNAWCNAHDVDLSTFDPAHLPALSYIFPKNTSNWHDNSIASGDSWLQSHLSPLLNSSAYAAGDVAVVFVTDEETPAVNALIAPSVTPGSVLAKASHFSLTRLTDSVLGLPAIGQSALAPDLLPILGGSGTTTTTTPPPPATDTDGDGTPDSTDQCPNVAGPASNHGCPVTPPPPTGCGDTVKTFTGTQTTTARGTIPAGKTWDATGAVWNDTTPYPVTVAGGSGACWVGGVAWGTWPYDTTPWTTFHGTGAYNLKGGADHVTVKGAAAVNYGDSFRVEDNSPGWTYDHVKAYLGHDDGLENDWNQAGTLSHSRLESYVVYSSRGDSAARDGSSRLVTLDSNLLWAKPTPTVYKGTAPGNGEWFKLDQWSPKVALTHNVLRADRLPNHGDLKPPANLGACSGNYIIWGGSGAFPETATWKAACPDTTIYNVGGSADSYWAFFDWLYSKA